MKKLPFIIVSCLFTANTFAQRAFFHTLNHFDEYGEGKRARLQRWYIGYGVPTLMNLDISTSYHPDDISTTQPIEQQFKATGVSGRGAQEGTFYILSRTGRQNAFCFELGFSEYIYTYSIGPFYYGSATIYDEPAVAIVGLPVGIAYKSGGEVSLNKNDKSTLSLGVGMAPTCSIAKILAPDTRLNVRGYIALEIGLFAGIEWKLRATYYSGKMLLVNKQNDDLSYASHTIGVLGTMDVKAVASGDLNVALVILPFSFKWSR